MTSLGSGVSGRCDNCDPLTDCFLGSLINDALRTRNIIVSTKRYIQHADVVTLTIPNYPFNSSGNVLFTYATAFTYFYQHELRFMGQPAIRAITELSITGSGD